MSSKLSQLYNHLTSLMLMILFLLTTQGPHYPVLGGDVHPEPLVGYHVEDWITCYIEEDEMEGQEVQVTGHWFPPPDPVESEEDEGRPAGDEEDGDGDDSGDTLSSVPGGVS